MDEKRIREFIDACRPGSEDLADGAMQELNEVLNTDTGIRELYEQTQASDAAIRTALHQVDVPDDLASRLLQRLTQSDAVPHKVPSDLDENDTQIQARSQSAADSVNSYRRWTRRRWLAVATLASAAVIGGLVLVPHLLTPRMNADELSLMALDWIALLDGTWNDDLSAAPERLQISDYLSAQPSGWQAWRTPLDDDSAVYRLISPSARGNAPALFVTGRPNRIRGLTTTPPAEPLANTAGLSSGVWREKGCLYVLVVPGGRRQYQSCLRMNQQLAVLGF